MHASLGLKSQARNPAYGRSLDEAQASRSLTGATTLSRVEMAEGELNAVRKRVTEATGD